MSSIPQFQSKSQDGSQAHTAEQIGYIFMKRYYDTLTREPETLYKFYKDDSTVAHGTESEPNLQSVSGLEVCCKFFGYFVISFLKKVNYSQV